MMTTNLRIQGIRPFLLGLLVTVGISCSGAGGGMTQTEFCAQKATKECEGVAAACLSEAAACKAARVMACEEFAAAQQAAPSSAALRPFRADKAGACISKAAEVYKKSPITPADRIALDEVCATVFSGNRKDTDPDPSCHFDYECDSPQICDVWFKTCAKQRIVETDGGCNNPGEVCPPAQFCAEPTPHKCKPKLTTGMACDDDTNPCQDTLRCSAGVCAAPVVTLGKACTADSDCVSTAPYCDSYNGSICTPGFIPSPGSNECVAAFGGVDTNAGTGGASGGGTGGAAGI